MFLDKANVVMNKGGRVGAYNGYKDPYVATTSVAIILIIHPLWYHVYIVQGNKSSTEK